jgi:Ca2+-binding EF-hand superfamily protein
MLTEIQRRKLIKLFSMYDTNNTGAVSRDDFDLLFKKMSSLRNWSVRAPKCLVLQDKLSRMWKNLSKQADLSHNKQVSLDEWLTYKDGLLGNAQAYTDEVQSLIELLFDVFDKNEDGYISEEEWGQVLSVYNVSPIYAAEVFPALTKEVGRITKEELIKLVYDFYYSDDPDNPANTMFGPY